MEDYTNAIYEGKTKYVTNYTNDSNKHHLETKEQYKIAIDPFDDMNSLRPCSEKYDHTNRFIASII